jgi:hypothetical protein
MGRRTPPGRLQADDEVGAAAILVQRLSVLDQGHRLSFGPIQTTQSIATQTTVGRQAGTRPGRCDTVAIDAIPAQPGLTRDSARSLGGQHQPPPGIPDRHQLAVTCHQDVRAGRKGDGRQTQQNCRQAQQAPTPAPQAQPQTAECDQRQAPATGMV